MYKKIPKKIHIYIFIKIGELIQQKFQFISNFLFLINKLIMQRN